MTDTTIPARIDDIIQAHAGAMHARCAGGAETEAVEAEEAELRAYVTDLQGKLDGANATWRRAQGKLDAIAAFAEGLRYKGEFGFGPWQAGEGPDQEGQILDDVSSTLRKMLDPAWPTEADREKVYQQSLAAGLSDYEAREDAWPSTPGRSTSMPMVTK